MFLINLAIYWSVKFREALIKWGYENNDKYYNIPEGGE